MTFEVVGLALRAGRLDRIMATRKRLQFAADICHVLAFAEQLKADDAKRLKDLERENATLKRLLADAELEKAALKEIARGNFWARNVGEQPLLTSSARWA
jgi:septal ring factor EnvC (AmiA/AmiB activator)